MEDKLTDGAADTGSNTEPVSDDLSQDSGQADVLEDTLTEDVDSLDEGNLTAGQSSAVDEDFGKRERGYLNTIKSLRAKVREAKQNADNPEAFLRWIDEMAKTNPRVAYALKEALGERGTSGQVGNTDPAISTILKRIESLEGANKNRETDKELSSEIGRYKVFSHSGFTGNDDLKDLAEHKIYSLVKSGATPAEAVRAVAISVSNILKSSGQGSHSATTTSNVPAPKGTATPSVGNDGKQEKPLGEMSQAEWRARLRKSLQGHSFRSEPVE